MTFKKKTFQVIGRGSTETQTVCSYNDERRVGRMKAYCSCAWERRGVWGPVNSDNTLPSPRAWVAGSIFFLLPLTDGKLLFSKVIQLSFCFLTLEKNLTQSDVESSSKLLARLMSNKHEQTSISPAKNEVHSAGTREEISTSGKRFMCWAFVTSWQWFVVVMAL